MRYLTFVRGREDQGAPSPALAAAMQKFIAESLADGTLVQTGGLSRYPDATLLRIKQGKLSVTDGPFAEAKEVIGGYAIIEASSKEEAIRIGTAFMKLHSEHWPEWEGESEIRQIDFLVP
ncbi:MAG TPA: YciI family protein [Gemmatimonadales bacterium]|nr:YciI family protein [Gemmatimonadales bacterium]